MTSAGNTAITGLENQIHVLNNRIHGAESAQKSDKVRLKIIKTKQGKINLKSDIILRQAEIKEYKRQRAVAKKDLKWYKAAEKKSRKLKRKR